MTVAYRTVSITMLAVCTWIALAAGPPIGSLVEQNTASSGASSEPGDQLVETWTASGERFREAEQLLDWGRGRYTEEGLQLPETTLVVHPSLRPCDGRVGAYHRQTNEVVLCRVDSETVLHELAHAWVAHNLDRSDRARFLDLRGLDRWNNQQDEWSTRGTEHAAEILVWALSDHDRTVRWVEGGVESRRLLSIDNSNPAALTDGFELMTGRRPSKRTITGPVADAFSPETVRSR